MKIEYCPACESQATAHSFAVRNQVFSTCSRCHTIWQPTGASFENYGEEYFEKRGHNSSTSGIVAAKILTFEGFWRKAGAPPNSKVLEVGCATGLGLVAGRSKGWKMTGLDVADSASEHAKERGFPPGTVVKSLSEIDGCFFSAVGFFDALEHIPNPAGFLIELGKYLLPTARVVVVLPRADTLSRRILGAWWPHYLPDHWVHFSREGIRQLAERTGYSLESCFRPHKKVTPFTLVRHLGLHTGLSISAPTWPVFSFNIGQGGYVLSPKKQQ